MPYVMKGGRLVWETKRQRGATQGVSTDAHMVGSGIVDAVERNNRSGRAFNHNAVRDLAESASKSIEQLVNARNNRNGRK